MVRVDRDLKRCYFYRLKIDGDVKKPNGFDEDTEFPKSEVPLPDIIPYNPHFRKRESRQNTRQTSHRRISWSREADRVREISPRSAPELEEEPDDYWKPAKVKQERPVELDEDKIFYPPRTRRYSDDLSSLQKPSEKKEKKTKKISSKPAKVKKAYHSDPEPEPEPLFYPPPTKKTSSSSTGRSKSKTKTKKAAKPKQEKIRQQQEKRYRAQKMEQQTKKKNSQNLRKVKSETNLNMRGIGKEPLMKQADIGKSKHQTPQRWRPVGDRTRYRQSDKNTRSFASDYYF